MYSKCIVDPLRRQPIAMMALKGWVEAVGLELDETGDLGVGVVGLTVSISERRFVVEASIDGAAFDA